MDKISVSHRRFDIEQLHAFATVAEAGSVTAAAIQLHRSQSAISEQIRKLEVFCDALLFERSKKGTMPTQAGVRLLVHARKLLAQNDTAYQDMRGALMAGDLRLAITDYFRPSSIAGLLKGMREQFPDLRLHVTILKSALIEHDARGEFDVGLSMRMLRQQGQKANTWFRRIPLRREPLKWVADPNLEISKGAPIPLVALPTTCSLQSFVISRLEASRIPYFTAHSASGVGGLQSALAAGLGVACLNSSAIPIGVHGITRAGWMLPSLPEVEFSLIVPEQPKNAFSIALAEQLAARFS